MLRQRIALAVEAPVIELPVHRAQAQRHQPVLTRTGWRRCKFPVQRYAYRGKQIAAPQAHHLSTVQGLAIRLAKDHFRLPDGAGKVPGRPQRLMRAQYSPDHQQKRHRHSGDGPSMQTNQRQRQCARARQTVRARQDG